MKVHHVGFTILMVSDVARSQKERNAIMFSDKGDSFLTPFVLQNEIEKFYKSGKVYSPYFSHYIRNPL
jgi:hypothetical protein